mmetsp:Transcript_8035/g.13074  ORF Transcript_8035/g.13074 Transcript_8035/m.13074 type:complete len:157 (+) Transcript_8035:206-676(+)
MQPFTRLIVFLVTISCFFPLNVRSFHINNAQRIKQQHHLTKIKQTYINDLVAEEAALEATRIYGIDSPEARLAWETFEETRAAASHWAAASHTKKQKDKEESLPEDGPDYSPAIFQRFSETIDRLKVSNHALATENMHLKKKLDEYKGGDTRFLSF